MRVRGLVASFPRSLPSALSAQFIKLGRDLEEEEVQKVGAQCTHAFAAVGKDSINRFAQANEMTTESTRRFVTSCFAGSSTVLQSSWASAKQLFEAAPSHTWMRRARKSRHGILNAKGLLTSSF